jgi:hypothetical protein
VRPSNPSTTGKKKKRKEKKKNAIAFTHKGRKMVVKNQYKINRFPGLRPPFA